jgi:3-oxoacyl-[acyl-carrier-protein] synthase-3
VTNDDLAKTIETSHEWIFSHTGIASRHILAEDQSTSDMAIAAAKQALEGSGITAEDLDMIVTATASPDYLGFPSVACQVQDAIGAKNAGAFDLVAACTGFVYAVQTAAGFIQSGHSKHVLVIGVDSLSRGTNWNDRNTCVLFGDGGGAVIMSSTETSDDPAIAQSGVISSILRADGSGGPALIRAHGGAKVPFNNPEFKVEQSFIYMDGQQVYKFAVRVFVQLIKDTLKKENLKIEDLAWIVPHQANIRIIEAAADRLNVDKSKFFVNIDEYANTSAGTIPIALAEMNKKGLLKRGELILIAGFGGGLTYGSSLIRW